MPERHRILIVDDDAVDRQAVVRALRRDSAQIDGIEADVLEVDTVARAREALQTEEFACVFLDHSLPDGTSLDLLMELRTRGLATPVVVLTGQRDEEAIAEVMRAGAVDYLPKERLHPDLVARSLRAALRFLQSQGEKQAVLDEMRARDRAIAAASNGISIADPRQPDCPLVYVNDAFLRMTGYAEDEVIGHNCRFLQGPDTDPEAVQTLREAIQQEQSCQLLILNYRRDGTGFWNEVTVSPVRDAHGTLTHFVGVQTDVTERQEADTERERGRDALRASEEALRESGERLRDAQAHLETALSAGGIATWTWDVVGDRVVADANLARLFSVSPEDAAGGEIGVYLQAIYAEDRPRVQEVIADALAHRDDYEAEYRVVLPDGSHRWLATRGRVERDEEGRAVSLPGVVLDNTEQAERGQRERFLADLAERARVLTDPDQVIADALRSVGKFLGVARCVFVDIDIVADTCTTHPDYRADESVVSMAGVSPISAFGEVVVGQYGAGQAVTVDDVHLDRAQVPAENVAAYDALGIRAHVGVPVVHSSRLVSCIGAHSAVPRHWKPEEAELLRAVVDRTWLTVEVLRQQRALVREAEERREASERTAGILESITDAFYALDAEYRFSHINGRAEALWGRRREEILGQPFLAVFPQAGGSTAFAQHERVMAERTPLHYETVSPIMGKWVEVSIYPTADDGLSVFFRDISERKALEKEREQLAERERNIATQLQGALQPPPENVPGLAVGRYTKPALDEAQVGGDFFDIFPLDKELYAVVIGDVSGKGLAAAQQLALIRNSLRTTLYLYRAPAQAVAAISAIVSAHDLLVGFVTAWVGIYDTATGQITYASCGHEPGMIKRASTGLVELLVTTGPPLGLAENAAYGEEQVTLGPGDALLLYTDGISEAGHSRRDLLGTDGLTHLFEALPEGLEAQAEAEMLVARVSDFAGGVFRDDVAVLLARRE